MARSKATVVVLQQSSSAAIIPVATPPPATGKSAKITSRSLDGTGPSEGRRDPATAQAISSSDASKSQKPLKEDAVRLVIGGVTHVALLNTPRRKCARRESQDKYNPVTSKLPGISTAMA